MNIQSGRHRKELQWNELLIEAEKFFQKHDKRGLGFPAFDSFRHIKVKIPFRSN